MIFAIASKIDYGLLADAISHYENFGWQQIEVPWVASYEALNATYFDDHFATSTPGWGLVGSAEQGFIELAARDLLQPGRFMAVTPCFRNENRWTKDHQPWFLKLELWDTERDDYRNTMHEAVEVMSQLAPSKKIVPFQLGDTHDIVSEEDWRPPLELGSYGRRKARVYGREIVWNYGTGLALPRFSQA